ncbi:MAG: energy-coupling factor ABC transporter ATP-binding protein [Caldimicrobium sp.]|nr:energy-coupling factor ABC transporter ATP-binding protein [Caldimicrobium sp.]
MDPLVKLKVSIERFTFEDDEFSLRDIHFEVRKGEGIAVLGASGAGKTTLLKLLDGLYKNYVGEILLEGQEIRTLKPREIYSKMGFLFQNPEEQLFAEIVFDDIAFGPKNMGWAKEKIEEAVKKALNMVELEGFELKGIQNLSFGQKKRVALAGLLAMGQEILLLDEPTLGLDPVLEKNFIELFLKLKRKGTTLIIATHNVDLVPYFADKVIVLSKGKMVKEGFIRPILLQAEELRQFSLRPPLIALPFMSFGKSFQEIPLTVEEAEVLLKQRILS